MQLIKAIPIYILLSKHFQIYFTIPGLALLLSKAIPEKLSKMGSEAANKGEAMTIRKEIVQKIIQRKSFYCKLQRH